RFRRACDIRMNRQFAPAIQALPAEKYLRVTQPQIYQQSAGAESGQSFAPPLRPLPKRALCFQIGLGAGAHRQCRFHPPPQDLANDLALAEPSLCGACAEASKPYGSFPIPERVVTLTHSHHTFVLSLAILPRTKGAEADG